MSLHLSISLSVSISLYLSLYLTISIYLYLSLSKSVYLCLSLPIYLSVYLSICLSIYLSIDWSIDLSIYRSIDLSIYWSIDLIHPSIHPSYISYPFLSYLHVHSHTYQLHICCFHDLINPWTRLVADWATCSKAKLVRTWTHRGFDGKYMGKPIDKW